MPKRSLPIYAELVISELQQEAAFEKQSIDDDCPYDWEEIKKPQR